MFIKTIHKSGIQTFGLLLVIAGAGRPLAWPGGGGHRRQPRAVHLLLGHHPLPVPLSGAGRLSGPLGCQPIPGAAAGKTHPQAVRPAGLLRGGDPGGLYRRISSGRGGSGPAGQPGGHHPPAGAADAALLRQCRAQPSSFPPWGRACWAACGTGRCCLPPTSPLLC